MKEQKKKRLVAILLLVSCFISGYMLFISLQNGFQHLENLAKADSLIQKELAGFNISEQQISISTTRVDSNLSRKTYFVDVPPAFSKTHLHAELNRTFYNYAIKTPAKVTFPERDIVIQFLYHGTVIRTVSLQTDNNLILNRKFANILIAFDELPTDKLLSKLTSLGEPIPIVLKIENPIQANELKKQLGNRYQRILFWLQNEENDALDMLKQLQKVLPQAMILQATGDQPTAAKQNFAAKTSLTFIDANNAITLNERMGKTSFLGALDKLKAKRPHPIVIIEGSETTLSWFSEKLPELKKTGVDLRPPPKSSF